ncbi:hypothetical protein PEBR_39639 [Aspergillus terreus]|uniref:Uncharacterized protein n=1 Tax=Aspergillus terreus TaxID=33178 RepID=A0A5M3ZHG9_ASPTE|nr:hypothetical protein ATETN484_0016022900 [Aspergillus terreus]GFF21652.1 hypothetical protein PEBR_39639 [Aspergillus terreus]
MQRLFFSRRAKESGISKETAKILASRKSILKIGKEADLEDADMDGFIREFDFRIKVAEGYRALVDAIGLPEVLLICFDEFEVDDREDVTIPRFEEATDEEWMVSFSRLLAPSLQLKETCLKLSGVVYVIEHLHGLGTEISLFFACMVDAGDELTRGGGRLQTARPPVVCASDKGFGARFGEQDCDEVGVSLWDSWNVSPDDEFGGEDDDDSMADADLI